MFNYFDHSYLTWIYLSFSILEMTTRAAMMEECSVSSFLSDWTSLHASLICCTHQRQCYVSQCSPCNSSVCICSQIVKCLPTYCFSFSCLCEQLFILDWQWRDKNLDGLEERERKERHECRRITFRTYINYKERNGGGENENGRDKDKLLNKGLNFCLFQLGNLT